MNGVGTRRIISKQLLAAAMALAPLVLYLALAPAIAWPVYYSLLFPHPDRKVRDLKQAIEQIHLLTQATERDVTFKSANGKALHGIFFELPSTNRVFLVSHGRGNNITAQTKLARILLTCGGS